MFVFSKPNYKYRNLKESEDSFAFSDNVYVVSDGVTRDPKEALDFREKSMEDILQYYPKPSGAKEVADLFTTYLIEHTKSKRVMTQEIIKKLFLEANHKIKKYNDQKIQLVDYLSNDFYACAASAGVLINNKLYWGQICDCGIVVFDKDLKRKFQTKDDFEEFNGVFKIWSKKNNKKIVWGNPNDRKFWRSEFRNSSKHRVNNMPVSYGALTGERFAEKFINTGITHLARGDMVVFYTDGFKEHLKEREFVKSLKSAAEKKQLSILDKVDNNFAEKEFEKYGSERTLIGLINS